LPGALAVVDSSDDAMWTLAPAAVVLLSNQETLGAVLCLDTLCLTAVLGLTGGPMNPFSLIYLVLIVS
jgi:predicted exporter